jgi:predicted phage gp36 major capsid-like protein
MGKGKRVAAISLSFALFAGAATFTGVGMYKEAGQERAREARVAQIVERFKACPERFQSVKSCLSPEERVKKRGDADSDRRNGNYEKAGIAFAELLEESDAREMAGRCAEKGDTAGRDRILNVLSERQDAARRARQELAQ